VITKHNLANAFTDTNLHTYLQQQQQQQAQPQSTDNNNNNNNNNNNKQPGAKKLLLAGYLAHVAVSTTARQAHELGYEVLVCGDAVGDRDVPGARGEELVRMVLCEIADAVGTVVESGGFKVDG
jgi:nicotinamidase-related amidase